MPFDGLVVALSLLTSLSLYLYRRNNPSYTLPPGPKPLPILGNMFDMPISFEYKKYAQWGEKYGDVVHVNALGKHIVILNSVQAANDLLDMHPVTVLTKMDSGWSFAFKQYSEDWRRHRRVLSQRLGPAPARASFQTQARSAHTLLRSMFQTPERFAVHLRHAAAETIMSITYGYQIKPVNDPWVELAEQRIKSVGEGARPGRFLVNVFPWLKYIPAWFPGAAFRKRAARTKKLGNDLMELPSKGNKTIENWDAMPSFVTDALTYELPEVFMSDIKAVAATMYSAASDTSISVSHFSVLAFVMYPDIQARAQSELDGVLGHVDSPSFRSPTIEDRPRLPYIDAIHVCVGVRSCSLGFLTL